MEGETFSKPLPVVFSGGGATGGFSQVCALIISESSEALQAAWEPSLEWRPLPAGMNWMVLQAPTAVSLASFFSLALKIMLIYLGAPSDAAIMPIQNVYQENKQLKQLMRGRAGKPA